MTLNNNQFLSFRWAKKIQNLGFNLSTLFVWGLQQQVRPEIIKKYGELKFEDIVDYSRMYSSEIEYSDENIEKIIETL